MSHAHHGVAQEARAGILAVRLDTEARHEVADRADDALGLFLGAEDFLFRHFLAVQDAQGNPYHKRDNKYDHASQDIGQHIVGTHLHFSKISHKIAAAGPNRGDGGAAESGHEVPESRPRGETASLSAYLY